MSIPNVQTAAEQATFRPSAHDDAVCTTRHEITTTCGTLRYRARAGYLDVVEDPRPGAPAAAAARIFVTSYEAETASEQERRARPVTFVYNGGPGTASMWLHLGLFGPRRVVALDGTTPLPAPYRLVDNHETPLVASDLVIVDLVDTGYSRMAPDQDPQAFHGVARDIDLITEVIRLWLTRNERWASPVVLAGESYGVLRTAKAAERLATVHGLYPAALVLISSPVGPDSMDFQPGAIGGAVAFLPSYAAVAHFHGKHPGKSLPAVLDWAQEFAATRYLPALHAGHRLPAQDSEEVVRELAALTGLREEFVRAVRLKIDPGRYFAELLRPEGKIVGRNDGRLTAWARDGAREVPESDPAYDLIRGAYAAGMNDYLHRELGFHTDVPYEVLTRRVAPWQTGRGRHDFVAVDELSRVLRTVPGLRISYELGWYDLCTPFWGAHNDVAQLEVPRALLDQITFHHYPSGHMTYLDEASRIEQSGHLVELYRTLMAR